MFAIKVNSRIKLKLLSNNDATDLYALIDKQRPYLGTWLPWVKHVQCPNDSKQFISRCMAEWEQGAALHLGIIYDHSLCGMIGFHEFNVANRFASIGYWLSNDHTSNGIMLRSCAALIEYGFTEANLHRIEIRCAADNTASQAIPRRLGFTQEGTHRDAELLDSGFVNQTCFGLLAPEWPGIPQLLSE